jgi:hypothetical protein
VASFAKLKIGWRLIKEPVHIIGRCNLDGFMTETHFNIAQIYDITRTLHSVKAATPYTSYQNLH